MPVSIFIAFPLINLVAGGVYYLFIRHLKKGHTLYSVIVLIMTVLLAVITALNGRSANYDVEKFRDLLLGLEIIEGIMAAFILPYLANHPKIYLTDKDIRGEE